MPDAGGGASRSTDPAAGTSASTDVSLREHLSDQIAESRRDCREGIAQVEKAIALAQRNAEENIRSALVSIDKRFASVNEFRDALSDLSKTMATSVDLKNLSDRTSERFDLVRDSVDKLNTRMDLREGQEEGSRLTTTTLVTLVTVAVAVLGLIIVAANYFSSRGM